MSKIKVFYSYSHEDEEYRIELEKWLVQLRRDNLIDEWHDRKLLAGDHLDYTINKHLHESDIILRLLSQNFLASEKCFEEMNYAINNFSKQRAISIILKTCTWEDTECHDLLALPKDGIPISGWECKEDAWKDIYNGIKSVINDLQTTFKPKETFIDQIEHVEFVNQNKKKVILNDIFVFPCIIEENNSKQYHEKNIDYKDLSEPAFKYMIIIGDELSGKTSLCRYLYKKFLEEENLAILLDGTTIHKTKDFDKCLSDKYYEQLTGDYERWKVKENRIILIDDYSHSISPNMPVYLKENFTKVILFMNDDEFLLYFKDDPSFADFKIFSINRLSLRKQEELIRNWKALSDDNTISVHIDDTEIDQIENKINNVISANRIVPRYPFYILSILQSLEDFMPRDYNITTYGHCYQALITAQLLRKNIRPGDVDTCLNFLTHLAFAIYENSLVKDNYFGVAQYQDFLSTYKEKFYISDDLIRRIENEEYPILRFGNRNGSIRFEYSYSYYFFLGKYFAENDSKDSKNMLYKICNEIYLKENAFIVIFTIHHAQNNELIDTIMIHSMLSYEKYEPIELNRKDTLFMDELILKLPESIMSNKSVTENRNEILDKVDNSKELEIPDKEPSLIEINKAIKIIEVLGQILKNRGGSLEKEIVNNILKEVQDLGLRVLNYFLQDLKSEDFKKWLIARIHALQKDKDVLNESEQIKYIEKIIQVIGYFLILYMIDKISNSIGSEKLLDAIADSSTKNGTPAYKLISYIVSTEHKGVNVDNLKRIKAEFENDRNYWVSKTISLYVQSYMNTHFIDFKNRQKIYSLLKIPYIPN